MKADRKAYQAQYRVSHLAERKAYDAQYYADHVAESKAYCAQYQLDHLEERKAYQAHYYKDHLEKFKASSAKYRSEHAEELKAAKLQYQRTHENERKAYAAQYYVEHPDKFREASRKRSRLKKEQFVEYVDDFKVFERDGWVCGVCGLSVGACKKWPDQESATLDHIIPLAKGGPHMYANVQLAHARCNLSKSDTMPDLIHWGY